MKLLLAIGLAALAYGYVTHHQTLNLNFDGSGPMDGTVWEVRIKQDSWFSLPHKDTLVFDSGRMTAVNYMAAGFPSGNYYAAGRKGLYSWQVSLQRANNETINWTGHIEDNHVEGDIMQRDSTGHVRQSHFKGSRRFS